MLKRPQMSGYSSKIIEKYIIRKAFDIDTSIITDKLEICVNDIKKINEKILKTGFGWFVLVMGIYIITKELLAI